MPKFRKKPVVIEAMQVPPTWEGNEPPTAWAELALWLGAGNLNWRMNGNQDIEIKTLEGTMTANKSDWIIKGVKGEFYPCKPDIFAATYEPVVT